MPRRSDRPGFKRGRHRLPYWIARQVVSDPMGFPDKCIPLDPAADDDTLARLCREHTGRLEQWIAARRAELAADVAGLPQIVPIEPYTGSVLSASRYYQTHPLSDFHNVKHTTQDSYIDSLKVIEQTIGARRLKNVTTADCKHWYKEWRKGAVKVDADGNQTIGPQRIKRAHDAISMFRTVVRFLASLRVAEAKVLEEELRLLKFEKGGGREEEMTYAYVTAFIDKALEFGEAGIMPSSRALYLAIGTAAQFELLLRQKDIIGERLPTAARLNERAAPKGASIVDCGQFHWAGFFTWENIPGWRWRMKTSKSKYRTAADFDLTRYGLLMPLLEAVPQDARVGAIVKDETGQPVREGSYRRWFRTIARAAAIPDEVWSMDNRAGGATEAEDSGADIRQIQDALTHTKETMTLRYLRKGRTRSIAAVAEIRQLGRTKKPPGTG